MDFDKHHFLTDVFELMVKLRGEPLDTFDVAVAKVVSDHVKDLQRVARQEREAVLGMAEEIRGLGWRGPVATRWPTRP